ncbi:FkbM family methyltransferase [Salinisphaera sp. C84B14]|uniref:FkbM family methyltransferase n=1 Tax=Salinisphaera sp. C84B14 TaxID=1304155 RepID=UPI003340CE66
MKPVVFNGIDSPYDWKLFDRMLPKRFRPSYLDDVHDYESALMEGLVSSVKHGDHVVVIGGGVGITAVSAANLAGKEGQVTCYEASQRQLPLIERCIARNGVEDRVTLVPAAIARNSQAYGGKSFALPVMPASELPECDVLEMDCEGAEAEILDALRFRPRVIIVETHGVYGAPTQAIHEILDAKGYDVADFGWAEPRVANLCEKNDIRVLLGS